MRNRADGPRRAVVSVAGLPHARQRLILEALEPSEHPGAYRELERVQPLGARRLALFALEADDERGLVDRAGELLGLAEAHIDGPDRASGAALVESPWTGSRATDRSGNRRRWRPVSEPCARRDSPSHRGKAARSAPSCLSGREPGSFRPGDPLGSLCAGGLRLSRSGEHVRRHGARARGALAGGASASRTLVTAGSATSSARSFSGTRRVSRLSRTIDRRFSARWLSAALPRTSSSPWA